MKKNIDPPEKFKLSPENMPTMMLINDVSKLFHDKLRNYNEQVGISDGYRHILFCLAREEGRTQYEISKRTHLKAPTVSVALQKMEVDGLVERHTDKEDQRQSRVYLTAKGREYSMMFYQNLKKTEAQVVGALSEDEEKMLRELLMKMRETLIEE